MPKYFFDVETDVTRSDLEGTELPDEATARAFAEGLAETLKGSAKYEQPNAVVIRDEGGEAIGRVIKAG